MSTPTTSAHGTVGTPQAILDLLAAVVRGEAPDWPPDIEPADVLRVAAHQGLDVLVASRIGELSTWPEAITAVLAAALRDACVIEVLRERELVRVLATMHEVHVQPLLVKGTALAYSLYAAPHLRPRIDTDLLVAAGQVDYATRALETMGYAKTAQNVGRLVSHQVAMVRLDAHGIWHAIDIHWKVANPHVFANLLTFEELAASAAALPALGPRARTPAPALAMMVAAVHLAAHHAHHVRLIWLYDLHLLCSRMRPDEFDQVVPLAKARGLATVCSRGLHLARRWFDTSVPASVLAELDAVDARSEEPARYVAGSVGKLGTLVSDLRTLPTWRARAELLYEHAFPPADYMLRSYRRSRRTWLPALYIHRMIAGGWRWLRQV